MPRISVIIPVYNCESYIGEALKSILNQSVQDVEIIVVNDGSTDGTLSVAEAFAEKDKNIRIISQTNSGKPAVARNVGLRHAAGEYICFLDGDDLFLPGKLEKQLEIFRRFPELNLVFHDVRHLYEDNRHDLGSYLATPDSPSWRRTIWRQDKETSTCAGRTSTTSFPHISLLSIPRRSWSEDRALTTKAPGFPKTSPLAKMPTCGSDWYCQTVLRF